MKITKQRNEECRAHLRKLLRPGMTVWTVMRHRSQSGMYRAIDFYVIKKNEPYRISGWAADLLEGYDRKHEACRASGCGMDMGFHLVYNLGRVLWPSGVPCIGEKCSSNEHSNGDRNRKPHLHKDSGYALRQQWL